MSRSRIPAAPALALAILGAVTVARAGEAPALFERLDLTIAAALVELDRAGGGSGGAPAPAPGPHPAGLSVGLDPSPARLAVRRLDRLLARLVRLLGEAERTSAPDPLVRRLVVEARRAVAGARDLFGRDGLHDPGRVREALLRADAASAALWSLLPPPAPP